MTSSLTLSDAVIPVRSATRDTLLVVGGAALTAVCAQVTIPWNPVPFTLQTLAVYAVGLTLGSRKGFLSMLLYVVLGACSLPVFAKGASGIAVLTGATGGYLLAFVAASTLLGALAERGWDRKVPTMVAGMLLAEALVLGVGSMWLSPFVGGYRNAFQGGVAPFLVPEVFKILAVCVGAPAAWTFLQRTKS